MKKSDFQNLIKKEIRRVIVEGYLEQNNLDIPEFKKLSSADQKTLEKLVKKHDSILDKDDAAFEKTSDFVSDDSFSSLDGYKEYYGLVKKHTRGDLSKVAAAILSILNKVNESAGTRNNKVTEGRDSLAAYYNQAGRIGAGEYNLRNVLEEIDDLLRSIPDKTTRYELFTVISDAIDMVYELGMEEGSNQEKGNF